mmetsp:Transcript_8135/g.25556  ORF Transcript_8135/g.25556 Transcript_8135/m.25556 type:complete len:1357 (-) Transcript_8135:949-5019(-)
MASANSDVLEVPLQQRLRSPHARDGKSSTASVLTSPRDTGTAGGCLEALLDSRGKTTRQVVIQLVPFALLAIFSLGTGLFFSMLAYQRFRNDVTTEMDAYATAVASALSYIIIGTLSQTTSIASSAVPVCNSIMRHAAAGIGHAPLSMAAEDMLASLRQTRELMRGIESSFVLTSAAIAVRVPDVSRNATLSVLREVYSDPELQLRDPEDGAVAPQRPLYLPAVLSNGTDTTGPFPLLYDVFNRTGMGALMTASWATGCPVAEFAGLSSLAAAGSMDAAAAAAAAAAAGAGDTSQGNPFSSTYDFFGGATSVITNFHVFIPFFACQPTSDPSTGCLPDPQLPCGTLIVNVDPTGLQLELERVALGNRASMRVALGGGTAALVPDDEDARVFDIPVTQCSVTAATLTLRVLLTPTESLYDDRRPTTSYVTAFLIAIAGLVAAFAVEVARRKHQAKHDAQQRWQREYFRSQLAGIQHFLFSVSHDLRWPVHAIHLLLAQTPLDAEKMKAAMGMMNAVMENMLDVANVAGALDAEDGSKAETGRARARPAPSRRCIMAPCLPGVKARPRRIELVPATGLRNRRQKAHARRPPRAPRRSIHDEPMTLSALGATLASVCSDSSQVLASDTVQIGLEGRHGVHWFRDGRASQRADPSGAAHVHAHAHGSSAHTHAGSDLFEIAHIRSFLGPPSRGSSADADSHAAVGSAMPLDAGPVEEHGTGTGLSGPRSRVEPGSSASTASSSEEPTRAQRSGDQSSPSDNVGSSHLAPASANTAVFPLNDAVQLCSSVPVRSLRRALLNLLYNASKWTQEGSIVLRCELVDPPLSLQTIRTHPHHMHGSSGSGSGGTNLVMLRGEDETVEIVDGMKGDVCGGDIQRCALRGRDRGRGRGRHAGQSPSGSQSRVAQVLPLASVSASCSRSGSDSEGSDGDDKDGASPSTRTCRSSNALLLLTVTDTGMGMQRDQLLQAGRLFGGTARREGGGAGLGLYMCRQLMGAHGGAVLISSRPDHGTSVSLVFPVGCGPLNGNGNGDGNVHRSASASVGASGSVAWEDETKEEALAAPLTVTAASAVTPPPNDGAHSMYESGAAGSPSRASAESRTASGASQPLVAAGATARQALLPHSLPPLLPPAAAHAPRGVPAPRPMLAGGAPAMPALPLLPVRLASQDTAGAPSAGAVVMPPLLAAASVPAVAGAVAGASASGKPLCSVNMLVVDDQSSNRRLLQRLLQRTTSGQVDTAVDGEDALVKLRAGAYAFVFMDVDMPRLDGIGATAQFRAWWAANQGHSAGHAQQPAAAEGAGDGGSCHRRAPFICVLSGHVADDVKRRALEAGADDFIGKGTATASEIVEFAVRTCLRREICS